MISLTRFLRQHCVGLLALFVALGGTSYAAAKLPRDSVGGAQIRAASISAPDLKRGSVTSSAARNRSLLGDDLANGTITGRQLAANSVGGAQLAPGSVTPSKLGALPAVRLIRGSGSSQAIPSALPGAGNTGVVFPTTEYGQGGFTGATEASSGASALVIPVTGVYAVSAGVRWATNATGNRSLFLSGPQPGGVRASTTTPAATGDVTRQTLATSERFEAGDQIFLSVSQTSGADLNISGSQNQQHFSATFLSP